MSNHGHDFATDQQRQRTIRSKKIIYRYSAWRRFCSWCQKETPAASTRNMTVCADCGN